MLIDVHSISLTSELLFNAHNKAMAGEPLSASDQIPMSTGLTPLFTYRENNHFQFQMRLLSEEHWVASMHAMSAVLARPDVQAWWKTERLEIRQAFAHVVDDLISQPAAR